MTHTMQKFLLVAAIASAPAAASASPQNHDAARHEIRKDARPSFYQRLRAMVLPSPDAPSPAQATSKPPAPLEQLPTWIKQFFGGDDERSRAAGS